MSDWHDFLDPFVIAYRENPTDENRALLLRAQEAHHEQFLKTQTIDFMARTMGEAR